MPRERATIHAVLYPLFWLSGGAAVGLGLMLVWGLEPSIFLARVLGSCVILAIGSGFAMSVTRIAAGRLPEDDGR